MSIAPIFQCYLSTSSSPPPLPRFKVEMSVYPTITRVCSALETLEAYHKSHPDNQPDTPPKTS